MVPTTVVPRLVRITLPDTAASVDLPVSESPVHLGTLLPIGAFLLAYALILLRRRREEVTVER